MRIQVTARSIFEVGQRSNQEDYLYPVLSDQPLTGDLFILCDGMGGHEKGEVASQTVCETMSAYIEQHRREDGFFDEEDFRKALSAAYDALDAKDTSTEKKMGTTLTFLKFHEGGCFVAHIGDSRIYQIRPATKSILLKTVDHSLVNDLVKLGEMTPEQALTSSQKNIITRAMQPHQERRAQADCTNLTDLQVGDYFYMCSDGMLEISEDSEIVNILSMNRSDADKIEILKGATRENRDNHSAHLIRIVSVDTSSEKTVAPAAPATPAASAVSQSVPKPASKPAPKAQQMTAKAPVHRSSSFRWIVPMFLGLVFLAAVTYGMVCMLNKTRKDPVPDPPGIQTENRVNDSRPQQNRRQDRPGSPAQTPTQIQNQTQDQTQTQSQPENSTEEAFPQLSTAPQVDAVIHQPETPAEEAQADVEAEYGTLMIVSYPPGASIIIDGTDTGKKTPHSFNDLSISLHSVELCKDGYITMTQEVDLSKQKMLNLTLVPANDGKENE